MESMIMKYYIWNKKCENKGSFKIKGFSMVMSLSQVSTISLFIMVMRKK